MKKAISKLICIFMTLCFVLLYVFSNVVLAESEDTEDEVVILEVIAGEDEETDEFISVEDESLLEEVFAEFLKRAEEEQ